MREVVTDVIDWLVENSDVDRDDYKQKRMEFDDVAMPILRNFYQPVQWEKVKIMMKIIKIFKSNKMCVPFVVFEALSFICDM